MFQKIIFLLSLISIIKTFKYQKQTNAQKYYDI